MPLNEAKILEKTYHDRLTVTRKTMCIDEETKESKYPDTVVYENIKCGLSNSTNKASSKEEYYHKLENEKMIFSPPGIEMQSNDCAVVITEMGQVWKGRTGKTFIYPSHGETELKLEEIS